MCSVAEQGSEHVRACSKFRAKRENNKDKTAQVTKDTIIYYKIWVYFFLSFHGKFLSFYLPSVAHDRLLKRGHLRLLNRSFFQAKKFQKI